ncbi:MAG: sigma-54 dependent transcriptional regulator [Bacillota bacterium]|nr:sigma-54 dependent transcriptional regulator [Bacillota bacterium]
MDQRVKHEEPLKRDNKTAAGDAGQETPCSERAFFRLVPGVGEVGVFSTAMEKVFGQAKKLHADRLVPVLIEGETGTGKDIVARYIHHGEENVTEPFVTLNCAAIAPGNAENELFGYVPGAYNGVLLKGKKGWLDMAQRGTLFLDHVAEMPLNVQAKLLRVIEDWAFFRVGGLRRVEADVRIICSTNANLSAKVEKGAFRADLYYRLNVARLYLPPLRQRKEEILPLAHMFLTRSAHEKGKKFREISAEAARMLTAYEWPGNLRELKNAVELAALMWDDVVLRPAHLEIAIGARSVAGPPHAEVIDCKNFSLPLEGLPLEEYNSRIILKALEMHYGNKTRTARYLGISRRSLDCRLKRLSNSPI